MKKIGYIHPSNCFSTAIFSILLQRKKERKKERKEERKREKEGERERNAHK